MTARAAVVRARINARSYLAAESITPRMNSSAGVEPLPSPAEDRTTAPASAAACSMLAVRSHGRAVPLPECRGPLAAIPSRLREARHVLEAALHASARTPGALRRRSPGARSEAPSR